MINTYTRNGNVDKLVPVYRVKEETDVALERIIKALEFEIKNGGYVLLRPEDVGLVHSVLKKRKRRKKRGY